MKSKIGFPKLCANETLLNEYYKDVSPVIDVNVRSFSPSSSSSSSSFS